MAKVAQSAARRNRRKARRRKAVGKTSTSTLPHARHLSLYDGQVCLGIIKVAKDGTVRAFDPDGERLGGDLATVKEAVGTISRESMRRARARRRQRREAA